MNFRRFIYVIGSTVFCALSSSLAYADVSADCIAGRVAKGPGLVIDSQHLPPDSATNLSSVTVCGINTFRYFAVPQVQSKISNPPTPPANLFSAGGGTTAATAANTSPNTSGAGGPQSETKNQPPAPTTGSTVDAEVQALLRRVTDLQMKQSDQVIRFDGEQIAATQKVACYQNLANQFSPVLLTLPQEQQLETALYSPVGAPPAPLGSRVPTTCTQGPFVAWDQSQTQTISGLVDQAIQLNADIAAFLVSPDYKTYINETGTDPDSRKADFATMTSNVGLVITQLQNILNPTTIATYNATVATANNWTQRATVVINTADPWDVSLPLTCHMQWFGKTESLTVSLPYTDYAQTTPTAASTPAFSFTNACVPSVSVSSGLGISTVRNSTFTFTPQTNYTVNPPVTTQVIGYASNARITPFYVGQMNYSYLHPEHSIGLHISGGAGVSTSSAGTTGDFFVGNAFSFFHRAIFVTPVAHFTQRQQLMSGYTIGNPQGSLTSVPTITSWKTGFALTITLPILQ